MPRHKQTLEQLLPAKADRDKVEELLQMVRDPHQDDWGLGAERRRIDAAIGRVSKAADNLHFLRLLPVGFAAQVSLDVQKLPIKLDSLEEKLRRACQALTEARHGMQKYKRPYRHNAIARFVAYLWERTGKPHHEIAASLLRPILGPEHAHTKWCKNHRELIEWHRQKLRQVGV